MLVGKCLANAARSRKSLSSVMIEQVSYRAVFHQLIVCSLALGCLWSQPLRRELLGFLYRDLQHLCNFRDPDEIWNKRRPNEQLESCRPVKRLALQWFRFQVLYLCL